MLYPIELGVHSLGSHPKDSRKIGHGDHFCGAQAAPGSRTSARRTSQQAVPSATDRFHKLSLSYDGLQVKAHSGFSPFTFFSVFLRFRVLREVAPRGSISRASGASECEGGWGPPSRGSATAAVHLGLFANCIYTASRQ
jgi:hypothetical protein